MPGAAQRAFAIPELLEAILLELAPQNVLVSQRVNKIFKAVIDGSVKLQRHLFFKQQSPCTTGRVRWNPMLTMILQYCSLDGGFVVERVGPVSKRIMRYKKMFRNMSGETHLAADADIRFNINRLPGPHPEHFRPGLRATSFEEMFITEEPMTGNLQLEFYDDDWHDCKKFNVGTLGDIVKGWYSFQAERGQEKLEWGRRIESELKESDEMSQDSVSTSADEM